MLHAADRMARGELAGPVAQAVSAVMPAAYVILCGHLARLMGIDSRVVQVLDVPSATL